MGASITAVEEHIAVSPADIEEQEVGELDSRNFQIISKATPKRGSLLHMHHEHSAPVPRLFEDSLITSHQA